MGEEKENIPTMGEIKSHIYRTMDAHDEEEDDTQDNNLTVKVDIIGTDTILALSKLMINMMMDQRIPDEAKLEYKESFEGIISTLGRK